MNSNNSNTDSKECNNGNTNSSRMYMISEWMAGHLSRTLCFSEDLVRFEIIISIILPCSF